MENIVILDCGSQFTQLIARRIRELKVHSEILPWDTKAACIKAKNPKGIVISGGPKSVLEKGSPWIDQEILEMGFPILGICYGMQYLCKALGGSVRSSKNREYGRTFIGIKDPKDPLCLGIPEKTQVWMSHGDDVETLPEGSKALCFTEVGVAAGFSLQEKKIFGLQFHPEVAHSLCGKAMISNFLFNICSCSGSWDLGDWIYNSIEEIKSKVQDSKVVCGLSGGVDSSVAAALVSRAVGDGLQCVFVDTGLLRQGESKEVMESYRSMDLKVISLDGSREFLKALKGITDPEEKRKAIGNLFVRLFEEESSKIQNAKWLLQGTLYPDVIESGMIGKGSSVIKSHHNVGGLPKDMKLQVLEPLRDLFKDEVRAIGKILGVPSNIVNRHPFPGPGLAVRCLGEVTEEKLAILRQADGIFIDEIRKAGLYDEIWQAFGVLLPVQTVGVMGDERTYGKTLGLRAITSQDGMTAEWFKLPYDVLDQVSTRICNEVKGINRVVYDVTSKPPATVEWE